MILTCRAPARGDRAHALYFQFAYFLFARSFYCSCMNAGLTKIKVPTNGGESSPVPSQQRN